MTMIDHDALTRPSGALSLTPSLSRLRERVPEGRVRDGVRERDGERVQES
jgi:hypothetical protein